MTVFEKFGVERKLRLLHGWLGALILPWIVLAGATGIYMNHQKTILSVFPQGLEASPEAYLDDPGTQAVENSIAAALAASRIRPDAPLSLTEDSQFQGRLVFTFDTGPGTIVVDRETGFIWVRDRYRETAYAPSGGRIDSALRWNRILSSLHQRGWVGEALGKWLADITATCLMLFGASGIILFLSPRLRRRRNRKARLAKQANA